MGVLKSLITDQEDLGQALNAGLATAVGAEILEGLKYLDGAEPYANETGIGFVPDPVIRSLGVPLVTGDIPGVRRARQGRPMPLTSCPSSRTTSQRAS